MSRHISIHQIQFLRIKKNQQILFVGFFFAFVLFLFGEVSPCFAEVSLTFAKCLAYEDKVALTAAEAWLTVC